MEKTYIVTVKETIVAEKEPEEKVAKEVASTSNETSVSDSDSDTNTKCKGSRLISNLKFRFKVFCTLPWEIKLAYLLIASIIITIFPLSIFGNAQYSGLLAITSLLLSLFTSLITTFQFDKIGFLSAILIAFSIAILFYTLVFDLLGPIFKPLKDCISCILSQNLFCDIVTAFSMLVLLIAALKQTTDQIW